MKKILCVTMILVVLVVMLCGCNRQIFDTHFKFDEAIVTTASGEIIARGAVDSWTDYEDGDQLQVTINGTTYLTHATNVILIDR